MASRCGRALTERSDPIRSDPIRPYPILSDPTLSDPIRSDPTLSDLIRSDLIRSDLIRPYPILSDPIGSDHRPQLSVVTCRTAQRHSASQTSAADSVDRLSVRLAATVRRARREEEERRKWHRQQKQARQREASRASPCLVPIIASELCAVKYRFLAWMDHRMCAHGLVRPQSNPPCDSEWSVCRVRPAVVIDLGY
jgi:hypothetical protein